MSAAGKRVTQAEFARLSGVNRSTVHRWIASGRIEVDAQGLLDPSSAEAQRLSTESTRPCNQARKAQIEAGKAANESGQYHGTTVAEIAQPGATSSATEGGSVREQIERERLRKERAQADLLVMERDKARGALVDLAYHRLAVKDQAEIVRGLIESMPHRLAPVLAACKGDVGQLTAELENFAHEFMEETSAAIKRRAEALGR